MAIPLYLAKTAAEFASTADQPDHLAWMACHFSPYGTGLSNLPSKLPENTLLILNDRTPVHGHDPKRIRYVIEEIVAEEKCCGVLLDFQRPDCSETVAIIHDLLALPCPVCVSDLYAKALDCPVFLPPVPLTVTLEEHLTPWLGREIWLETATESTVFTVTKTGYTQHAYQSEGNFPFYDKILHCHYRIELQNDSARFYLIRNKTDLSDLLEESAALGVTQAVGLWQELKEDSPAPL